MTFKNALLFTCAVLILHFLLIVSGGYGEILNVDVLMHVLGGFAMGLFGIALYKHVAREHHKRTAPTWYALCFILGFVMLIGVAWEFHEFLLDISINVWYQLPKAQISLLDTMKDFFNDFLGGCLACLLFYKSHE